MTRQEEADEIVKACAGLKYTPEVRIKAENYANKYFQPKDPLFEKWTEMWDWYVKSGPTSNVRDCFNKAKELGLFTAGLDEAIESIGKHPENRSARIIAHLKVIKERLDNGPTG